MPPSDAESPIRASQYVYPRSVVRDVAITLASLRARVGADHLAILDLVALELADTFEEFHPGFDAEQFLSTARTHE